MDGWKKAAIIGGIWGVISIIYMITPIENRPVPASLNEVPFIILFLPGYVGISIASLTISIIKLIASNDSEGLIVTVYLLGAFVFPLIMGVLQGISIHSIYNAQKNSKDRVERYEQNKTLKWQKNLLICVAVLTIVALCIHYYDNQKIYHSKPLATFFGTFESTGKLGSWVDGVFITDYGTSIISLFEGQDARYAIEAKYRNKLVEVTGVVYYVEYDCYDNSTKKCYKGPFMTATSIKLMDENALNPNNFCNEEKNGIENCNGRRIKITGTLQEPKLNRFEIKQNWQYINTTYGEIVLLSDNQINCPKIVEVNGILDVVRTPECISGNCTYLDNFVNISKWTCKE